MRFTDEQILAAGAEVLKEGKLISPFAIRNKLGGGCPKRIKKVWDAQSPQEALTGIVVTDVPELPSEFQDTLEAMKDDIERLAAGLYARAYEVSESRVRDSIKDAQKTKGESIFVINEAMDSVSLLDKENENLRENIESQKKEIRDLNAQFSRLQERHALSEKSLFAASNKLEVEVARSKKYETEAIELRVINTSITKTLEVSEVSTKTAQNKVSELKAFEQKFIDASNDKENLNKKLEKSDSEIKALALFKAKFSLLEKENKVFEKKLETAVSAREKSSTEAAVSLIQVNEKSLEITRLTKDLSKCHKDKDSAIENAALLKGQLNTVERQLLAKATQLSQK